MESGIGAEILIDGRRLTNFGGSSYLGLSSERKIVEAGINALEECGGGPSIHETHGLVGQYHRAAENAGAEFFNTPTSVFLGSGYVVGLVALTALQSSFDALYYDELSHFSLRDAMAVTGSKSCAYNHIDADDLESKIKRSLRRDERPLIISDGVFSTYGEIAPLPRLVEIAGKYGGRVLVDEAHAFGVLGEYGRGTADHYGLPVSAVIAGGSLGKAFGVIGGIIPTDFPTASSMRMTPAGLGAGCGSAAAAAMAQSSLRYVQENPRLRERLRENTNYLKKGLRGIGLNIIDSPAPIAAFAVGSFESTSNLKATLMQEDVFVYHSNYIGAERQGVIRCGIFASHTREHLDQLLSALQRHV